VHSSVEHSPGYSSRVLSLEEEGLGLAILEAEDLAVTTDVELALFMNPSVNVPIPPQKFARFRGGRKSLGGTDLARVDLGGAEGVVVGTHLDGMRYVSLCCIELSSFSRLTDRSPQPETQNVCVTWLF